MTTTAEAYLATWNADDADRERLLAEHGADDATYTDPLASAAGRDAIGRTIEAVRGQFPGHVFTVDGVPDAHHEQVRFRWALGRPGEEPLVIGFDVVVLDDDGRIRQVLGFLDRVPDAA